MNSAYDPIAEMYDRNWKDWYLPEALPALQKLFFDVVPAGSRVLDVCCGSGHVTGELTTRGYRVTGVDLSEQLVRRARIKIADAAFVVQDARALGFRPAFDAALSTFDSLNHLLTLADLETAFDQVRSALRDGGLFVCDLNGEGAYRDDMSRWHPMVEGDSVSLIRGTYDAATKIGTTDLIWFERRGGEVWGRRTSTVEERCYERDEVLEALRKAGFTRTDAMAASDAGIGGDIGLGRTFFSAWR